MPIIGMMLKEMHAKRNETSAQEIKINSTPKIVEVKETTVQSLDKKVLSMDFDFTTTYTGVGEIKLGGNLLYLAEDNKPVLDQWKKDKSLPDDVSVSVLNHLFRRCLLKIANIAEDLQLPAPLQFPLVKPKGQD